MSNWSKRDTARFLGISTNALDHWVDRGCPADRNAEGRITGLNINEVLLWASRYQSRDIQKRAQDALPRLVGYILCRAGLYSVDGSQLIGEAGLRPAEAKQVWDAIIACADRSMFEFACSA